jgi:hypothetical protein
MAGDFEKEEYFALMKTLTDSDQRLLTVKGWGVTLSLVALGLGFQYRAYGFFVIAAISSLAFWIIEHAGRRHQMRHYVRMREIEVNRYERSADADKSRSSPRIDWSWHVAPAILRGEAERLDQLQVEPRQKNPWYTLAWLMPHVALPHALTLLVSAVLVLQGINGHLGGFTLGASPPPPPKADNAKT